MEGKIKILKMDENIDDVVCKTVFSENKSKKIFISLKVSGEKGG